MTHVIGELEERMRANQSGLLSLFSQAGIPTGDIVRLKDLAILRRASHGLYLEAVLMLYPETKAGASPIGVYQNGLENSLDRIDRLGIDPEYSYTSHVENFESVQNELVSYKTIFTWVVYGVIIAFVAWLLWYFYKKMK